MAITVQITFNKDLEVTCDVKTAFDLLVDVPKTTALYPKLDKLVNIEGSTYRWEMAKIGAAGLNFQTVYTVKYTNDGAARINWEVVEGNKNDNAKVSGGWIITSAGDKKTKIAFTTEAALDLPVPSLMKKVVDPVIRMEFESQTNAFLAKVKEALSKG
jgi:hypothetical protein